EQEEGQLWIVPAGDATRTVSITSGDRSWTEGLGWLPDGRIVAADSMYTLWTMTTDGASRTPLVNSPFPQWGPPPCGLDRFAFIRFEAVRDHSLWTAGLDAAGPRQLMAGRLGNPSCTPDGRFVIINAPDPEAGPTLWKISTADGARTPL